MLLCEDRQTDSFVRRFLRNRNFGPRDIHTLMTVEKSGEQWVRERYPDELKAIRRRQGAVLLVVTDADTGSTDSRRLQLDRQCSENGVTPRTTNDPVVVIIPRRNIETWFAYLKGEGDVDETSRYHKLKRKSDCHPLADELHRICHEKQQLDPSAPASLKEACREYPKLSAVLR